MKLLTLTGRTIRSALSTVEAPKLSATADAARVALKEDLFAVAPVAKTPVSELASGVTSLAKIVDAETAYAFPPNFVNRVRALMAKAGIPARDAATNNMLNALLLREDKPNTAAFVRTVMETPGALDEALANIARYTKSPTNAILPEAVKDVPGAFDRVAFLPFLGSEKLAAGLAAAVKKDLELSGEQLREATKSGVGPDITIVGQGPTGAVLARGLAGGLPEGYSAAVVGGEPTFSAGAQWRLNSPNRAVTGDEFLGPGGPLNPIDDRLTDGDLSGAYYADANVIDRMAKLSLHASGLPVLTDSVTRIVGNREGTYTLRTASGATIQSNVVALAAGLGDSPRPLATPEGTKFVSDQYELVKTAIEQARAGNSKGLRNYPLFTSTLDFFRAREELNDPLAMFATSATAADVKALKGERAGVSRRVAASFNDYITRALYRSKTNVAKVPDGAPAQKVVGVVGFGDSARTALEAVTGFGPDTRSPRQLNVVPKLLWFVGESGPADCAEFYTGDLVRGFDGFNKALQASGTNLARLLRARLASVAAETRSNPQEYVKRYLAEFQNLLTTQKPKEYFDGLLENSGLSEQEKRAAFGVFLQERDAVRPRYNQLVIPIEKGQIELVQARVNDAAPVNIEGQPERLALTLGDGSVALVDHALDARGNVNDVASVVRDLTGQDKDPFNNPEKYDVLEVVDPAGNRRVVAKQLKGEGVLLIGPASGVVANNTTNVGANKVSIFLNRPLNELSAAALVNEVITRVRAQRGDPPAGEVSPLEATLAELQSAKTLDVRLNRRGEEAVKLGRADEYLRSSLDRDPLAHQTDLSRILNDVRVVGADEGERLSIRISPDARTRLQLEAPTALLPALREWVATRAATDFLRSATDGGRSVSIEREVGADGRLINVETWL